MKRLIFILVLLLLAGTVLLRYTHTVQEKPETPVPETESHAVEPEPAEPEHEIPTKEPTQPPELNQEADRSQSALQTGAEPDTQESHRRRSLPGRWQPCSLTGDGERACTTKRPIRW